MRSHELTGSDELKHIAEFPMTVIETYINKAGITFSEFMSNEVHAKRMISDPDLKGFRVWGGRV